jgi:adenylate cyclase
VEIYRFWRRPMAVLGASAVVAVVQGHFAFFADFDLRGQDRLIRELAFDAVPESFVIVAIDDASLSVDAVEPDELAASTELQAMRAGFPWSRTVYAGLLRRALADGARLVVLDLILARDGPGDAELAAALREAGDRAVLAGGFDVSGRGYDVIPFTGPNTVLAASGAAVGAANFPLSLDEVVRDVATPLDSSVLTGATPLPGETSVPALAALIAGRPGLKLPPSRIRFHRAGSVRCVPLVEVFVPHLLDRNHPDVFRDRVVVVGATASRLQDFHSTPVGRMSGPELQVQAAAALANDRLLRTLGPAAGWIGIAAATAAGLLVFARRHKPLVSFLWTLLGGVAWTAACAGAIVCGWMLPFGPFLVTWLLGGFAVLAVDFSAERRERFRLRQSLERYVSRDVVAEIIDNRASFLHSLGGQRRDITTLFCDLQGFTAAAQDADPERVLGLLNEYFGELVDVVFENRGTLDKFIGDAIMATWGGIGTPDPLGDARRAAQTALDICSRLAELNARRASVGKPAWRCGVGIAQGRAIFGNIGSSHRMEPTVLGDSVNLAARIESLTRHYECPVLTNAQVAHSAADVGEWVLIDTVRVKGRRTAEELWAVFPKDMMGAEDASQYNAARSAYAVGHFAHAAEMFAAVNTESPLAPTAGVLRKRCNHLINDPPVDWSGVWTFETK